MSNVCAPLEAIPIPTIITFLFSQFASGQFKNRAMRSVKINAHCMVTRTHVFIALPLFLLVTIMPTSSSAQRKRGPLVGTAAKAAEPANVKVVPELAKRVARFHQVEML